VFQASVRVTSGKPPYIPHISPILRDAGFLRGCKDAA
jgi:hypothetical protein